MRSQDFNCWCEKFALDAAAKLRSSPKISPLLHCLPLDRAVDAEKCKIFFFFFRRDALKEQFGKEPSTVRCLAVKSALLGTRHPRKEKEAALQNVTGEPACLCGEIIMCHPIGDGTKH